MNPSKCKTCNGSGLVQGFEVEDCPECGGDAWYGMSESEIDEAMQEASHD